MLSQEKRFNISEYIGRYVQGGCTEGHHKIFEDMIEHNIVTEQEFQDNEMEICGIFDDNWFTCGGCDWTVPMDMNSYNDNQLCTDCDPDDDDD